ncbi:MAG: hypothetical protein ACRED1_12830 [Limisphaerales bacterium]
MDRKLVKAVFLFLIPAGRFETHAKALADIAKLLNSGDFRDWLDEY